MMGAGGNALKQARRGVVRLSTVGSAVKGLKMPVDGVVRRDESWGEETGYRRNWVAHGADVKRGMFRKAHKRDNALTV